MIFGRDMGGNIQPMPDPYCQGDARFNSHDQALYVAVDLTEHEGGAWQVVAHGNHWHVRETA